MNKYIVKVKEVHCVEVEVEAEDIESARNKVKEELHNDEYMGCELTYSYTMEPEDWDVEKA